MWLRRLIAMAGGGGRLPTGLARMASPAAPATDQRRTGGREAAERRERAARRRAEGGNRKEGRSRWQFAKVGAPS